MFNRILHPYIILVLFLPLCEAADFYVSPEGSDAAPGTLEKPFQTLVHAQQRVRVASLRGHEPIQVHLRAGTYYLPKTFHLDFRDSGTKKAPILYTGYSDEEVILSGGVRLHPSWELVENGIYRTRVKPGLKFDQLFVNGKRQILARFPNFDQEASPYNGASSAAFSDERAKLWGNPTGGFIHAMHSHHWGGYHYKITGKDDTGSVRYEGGWQNNRQMGMHPKHRMVENIREELDAPGEWFFDNNEGLLYFKPTNAIALPTALVEAATLKHLVEFSGSPQAPIQHVSMKGFTFRHSTRTFMETREPLLRSDWTIYRGGAVLFNNAEDCGIQNCEFDQLGGNGIFVNKYNRRIRITSCHLHHCGASGICFVGDPETVRNAKYEYRQTNDYNDIDKTKGPKSEVYPSDCIVDDCLIHNMSMVEKQATGIQISMSFRITVRHCSIYDMGRAGINISEGTFGGHLIEHCDVFNTVRETGDHGSFNSWGRDRFWHLSGAPADELPTLSKLDTDPTIIRNSRWRCDRGWDVDLDDGSSHYEIYNNLFLRGGLKLREGFFRNVHNNIAINNSLHPHVWYDNSMDTVTRNIWMNAYQPAGGMPAGKWGSEVDRNLFTTVQDKQKFSNHDCDRNSLVGDPLFLDPANGDYRVAPDSPALEIGFHNFPMDRFGVRSASLKALSKTPEFPIPRSSHESTQSKPTAPSIETIWMGMILRPLKGEEFSAFGVTRQDGGLSITSIPKNTQTPFEPNDVIQKLNSETIRDSSTLNEILALARDQPLTVQLVRKQRKQIVKLNTHSYPITETAKVASEFKTLLLPPMQYFTITANPSTNNEPLSVLNDRLLTAAYGPVFTNGVQNGEYKLDLGTSQPIKQLTSWSYGMASRGTQHIMLYGSSSADDPGWDARNYIPIGSILAAGTPGQFTAAALRAGQQATLGRHRWILYRVKPVTDTSGGENTAFQEFAVELAPQP